MEEKILNERRRWRIMNLKEEVKELKGNFFGCWYYDFTGSIQVIWYCSGKGKSNCENWLILGVV